MTPPKKLKEYKFGRRVYELDIYEPHTGSCDITKPTKRRIVVNEAIDTPDGFDTLIHEALHAIDPKLSHKKIEKIAGQLSGFLLALGYRRK